MALSALFLPHYLGAALERDALRDRAVGHRRRRLGDRGDRAIRLAQHSRLHRPALVRRRCSTCSCSRSSSSSASRFLFSRRRRSRRPRISRTGQSWHDARSSRCRSAMLAYTGLETVANLAEETREPGKTLPRSLFSAIGLVVVLTVLIATSASSAFPAGRRRVASSASTGSRRRSSVSSTAFDGQSAGGRRGHARVARRLSGGADPLAASTTSMSGCTRLLHSMGGHEQLPRVVRPPRPPHARRAGRRSSRPPPSRSASSSSADTLATTRRTSSPAPTRSASCSPSPRAQAAVIRLRAASRISARPFRARPDIRSAGVLSPAAGPGRRAVTLRGLGSSR